MIDPHIFSIAGQQYGVIARQQLTSIGFSPTRISRATTAGWFQRLLPGVFLVAPAPATFEARCSAVSLWLGPFGMLSGQTAGRLHGLSRMNPKVIHCLVPHNRHVQPPDWVDLHRSRWFNRQRDGHVLSSGLTVTDPERTLFAIAAQSVTQRWFDHVADDAWNLRLVTPEQMAQYLDQHRCRGKNGVARIEAWLERSLADDRPTQSYFERDLLDALATAGVPAPAVQFPLELTSGERIHLDIAWPSVRLAIEPGHSRYHDPAADALRDLACAELGWVVHRLSEHARSDLGRFASLIASAYRRRRVDVHSPPTSPTFSTPHRASLSHPSNMRGNERPAHMNQHFSAS